MQYSSFDNNSVPNDSITTHWTSIFHKHGISPNPTDELANLLTKCTEYLQASDIEAYIKYLKDRFNNQVPRWWSMANFLNQLLQYINVTRKMKIPDHQAISWVFNLGGKTQSKPNYQYRRNEEDNLNILTIAYKHLVNRYETQNQNTTAIEKKGNQSSCRDFLECLQLMTKSTKSFWRSQLNCLHTFDNRLKKYYDDLGRMNHVKTSEKTLKYIGNMEEFRSRMSMLIQHLDSFFAQKRTYEMPHYLLPSYIGKKVLYQDHIISNLDELKELRDIGSGFRCDLMNLFGAISGYAQVVCKNHINATSSAAAYMKKIYKMITSTIKSISFSFDIYFKTYKVRTTTTREEIDMGEITASEIEEIIISKAPIKITNRDSIPNLFTNSFSFYRALSLIISCLNFSFKTVESFTIEIGFTSNKKNVKFIFNVNNCISLETVKQYSELLLAPIILSGDIQASLLAAAHKSISPFGGEIQFNLVECKSVASIQLILPIAG